MACKRSGVRLPVAPPQVETIYSNYDQTPVDLDKLDLICIDPVPSYIWYQDMADFADWVSDERAGRRPARAIQGKGAFRRFKGELQEEYPHLLAAPTCR